MNEGYSILVFQPVSNEAGENSTPGVPVHKSVIIDDGTVRGNASPDIIRLHDCVSYAQKHTADGTAGWSPVRRKLPDFPNGDVLFALCYKEQHCAGNHLSMVRLDRNR